MSLTRTLDRLFTEIRRESKRNPAFADRLDAVFRAHASERALGPVDLDAPLDEAPTDTAAGLAAAPALNPVAVFLKEGEAGLRRALEAGLELAALRHLVAEHNLDPSGMLGSADAPELVTHIVAQARKRVERDKKLFDY